MAAVIDIGSLVGARRDPARRLRAASALASELDRACADTGFLVVVGHGLDGPLAELSVQARAFFALPQTTKETVGRGDSFGFLPARSLAIDGNRSAATNELLDLSLAPGIDSGIGPGRPPLPGFTAAVARYQQEALALAALLLEGLALALDLEPTWFAQRMVRPECKLRLLHYLPPAGRPKPSGAEPEVLTEPHTDYGALTLLATGGVPGLEVLTSGATWTPIVEPPGSLVVNLGDMLARLTNLRYASTRHRVVGGATDRYSIPFFVNPDPDTVIECLPSCVSATNPCRYEPVTAADFLAGRIDKSIPEPYL